MTSPEILIVENDLLVAEDTAMRIQNLGYKLSGMAASAEEAFAILEKSHPDIILMDIDIDGDLDGVQLAAAINEKRTTPIIYLTDLNDPRTLNRTQNLYPALFMNKPFNDQMLSYHIELVISKWLGDKSSSNFEGLADALFVRDIGPYAKRVKILFDDIYYIRAARAYCEIYVLDKEKTTDKKLALKKYEPSSSMSEVMKVLSSSFMQVHRSYVINLKYIDGLYEDDIMLGDTSIPLGRSFKSEVKKRLKLI